ncbi:MAG: hypothetical protein P1U46_04830 [Patescibacteria group bacterium]|nr:hypothetical protein [Patescibacteria group bacterium]
MESLKKFKDQVDEILSFFDEYSEFSEEDLSLIKDKASPSFVSKIHQMEEFKEQRKSIAPKEIYHLHKKLLELLEKYFMDIDKLIKENNLEKLEEKNIKELKKFLIS